VISVAESSIADAPDPVLAEHDRPVASGADHDEPDPGMRRQRAGEARIELSDLVQHQPAGPATVSGFRAADSFRADDDDRPWNE
jgi:hypothetical protein